jgi:hypothetical protein
VFPWGNISLPLFRVIPVHVRSRSRSATCPQCRAPACHCAPLAARPPRPMARPPRARLAPTTRPPRACWPPLPPSARPRARHCPHWPACWPATHAARSPTIAPARTARHLRTGMGNDGMGGGLFRSPAILLFLRSRPLLSKRLFTCPPVRARPCPLSYVHLQRAFMGIARQFYGMGYVAPLRGIPPAPVPLSRAVPRLSTGQEVVPDPHTSKRH